MASQLVSTTVNGDVVNLLVRQMNLCSMSFAIISVLQVPRKAAVQAIAVRAALLWMGD